MTAIFSRFPSTECISPNILGFKYKNQQWNFKSYDFFKQSNVHFIKEWGQTGAHFWVIISRKNIEIFLKMLCSL